MAFLVSKEKQVRTDLLLALGWGDEEHPGFVVVGECSFSLMGEPFTVKWALVCYLGSRAGWFYPSTFKSRVCKVFEVFGR